MPADTSQYADNTLYDLIRIIILKWWDFMDSDCTANRNEYTVQQQNELIKNFISAHTPTFDKAFYENEKEQVKDCLKELIIRKNYDPEKAKFLFEKLEFPDLLEEYLKEY